MRRRIPPLFLLCALVGCASDDAADDAADDETPTSPGDDDTSGAGSEGGGELCTAVEGDDPCTACAKAMCCDAYATCYGDPDCVCAVECILETNDYDTCLGPMCNMPDATPAMDIGICYGTTCAADCGFGQ